MNYTNEQILAFKDNLDLFEPMKKVLRLLESDNIENLSMKEIGLKCELSTYPRDKVLLALEFSGFIDKKPNRTSKVYWITNEGRKLLEVMEEEND